MRILIVDDIFTNRFLLAEMLKKMNVEFDQAENGKQAIEALEKRHYDMILMDIEMPVMNGLETTMFIRQKMPAPQNSAAILALTAHDPHLFFEEFRDAGFDNIFAKPYSIEKLTAIIAELNL